MANSMDELNIAQPLIDPARSLDSAAETMLTASRTMLAAASAFSSGLGLAGARERELIGEAIETGFLRALRRDALLGASEASTGQSSLLGLSAGGGIPGTGYGRMGASVTGRGSRAQLYGSIGGAIGYAVGGPVGAVLGGMLGGLLGGGDDDEEERAQQEEALRRQWLNSPQGFEIEAYLYNLARAYPASALLMPIRGAMSPGIGFPAWPLPAGSGQQAGPVFVHMSPGAVQISGQSTEAGERAARAFAGALGRVLRLNSVVVPAAGIGGEI